MAPKLPSVPKSTDAEQAFLGALIMDGTGWEKITDKIWNRFWIYYNFFTI